MNDTDFEDSPVLFSFYYGSNVIQLRNIVIVILNRKNIIYLNHSNSISSEYIDIQVPK
jgi:hypothetical protein